MWHTWVVLLVVALVLVYGILHYVRAARSGVSMCRGCNGCGVGGDLTRSRGD